MAVDVTIDVVDPLGSETLKLGDDRIRNLAKALAQMFGFDGNTSVSTKSPFTLPNPGSDTVLATVNGDPTDPLGIATQQYAGRKVLFSFVQSGGTGVTYSGTTTPVTPTGGYDQNTLYIIKNDDNAGVISSGGGVQLQLNGGGFQALIGADGTSPLPAGNFLAQGVYLVVWDTANFRLIDFVGGTVTHPIQLPADPTTDLQAAPKQYVDHAVGHPVITPMAVSKVDLGGSTADIITYTFTTPNDGNNYLVEVSYGAWLGIVGPVTITSVATWVSVNGVKLALAGSHLDAAEANDVGSIGGSGICQTVIAANTPVTVILQGVSDGGTTSAHQVGQAGFGTDGPAAYLSVTLLRTSA